MRVLWFLTVPLMLALGGCSDTEERCEDACDAAERCDVLHPVDDCVNYCVEHYDDSSDKCQKAFDDLTDCLSENAGPATSEGGPCDACDSSYNEAFEKCDWMSPSS